MKDLSKRLAKLICGKTVEQSEYRPAREELVIRFTDGTRMYVDNHTEHLDISVEHSSEKGKEQKKGKYCCFRFRESVIVDKTIMKASKYDETEWYLPQGCHIYFCPFCGQKIKGKGFGTYAQAALTTEEMTALRRRAKATASKSSNHVSNNQQNQEQKRITRRCS